MIVVRLTEGGTEKIEQFMEELRIVSVSETDNRTAFERQYVVDRISGS